MRFFGRDPESKRMWEELRRAEDCWACRFLRENMLQRGYIHLYFMGADGEVVEIKINHCPRCGKRFD